MAEKTVSSAYRFNQPKPKIVESYEIIKMRDAPMAVAEQPALNEPQIKRTWEGMLGAEIRANYFADLVSRYNAEQKWLTWGTLFLSSGAFVSILAELPPEFQWLRAALVGLTAALSLWSVVRENHKNAVEAANLHSRWLKIANVYTDVWENIYLADAKEKLDAATALEAEASGASSGFPYEKGRMLKWERHVVAHHGLQTQN